MTEVPYRNETNAQLLVHDTRVRFGPKPPGHGGGAQLEFLGQDTIRKFMEPGQKFKVVQSGNAYEFAITMTGSSTFGVQHLGQHGETEVHDLAIGCPIRFSNGMEILPLAQTQTGVCIDVRGGKTTRIRSRE